MTNILEIVEGLKITSNRIEDGANEVSIIHGEKEDFIILDHAAAIKIIKFLLNEMF